MFDAFQTFGTSEWLRLAFTVLLCIPLFVVGMYLFGLFPEIIAGTDTAKRKRKTGDTADSSDDSGTADPTRDDDRTKRRRNEKTG